MKLSYLAFINRFRVELNRVIDYYVSKLSGVNVSYLRTFSLDADSLLNLCDEVNVCQLFPVANDFGGGVLFELWLNLHTTGDDFNKIQQSYQNRRRLTTDFFNKVVDKYKHRFFVWFISQFRLFKPRTLASKIQLAMFTFSLVSRGLSHKGMDYLSKLGLALNSRTYLREKKTIVDLLTFQNVECLTSKKLVSEHSNLLLTNLSDEMPNSSSSNDQSARFFSQIEPYSESFQLHLQQQAEVGSKSLRQKRHYVQLNILWADNYNRYYKLRNLPLDQGANKCCNWTSIGYHALREVDPRFHSLAFKKNDCSDQLISCYPEKMCTKHHIEEIIVSSINNLYPDRRDISVCLKSKVGAVPVGFPKAKRNTYLETFYPGSTDYATLRPTNSTSSNKSTISSTITNMTSPIETNRPTISHYPRIKPGNYHPLGIHPSNIQNTEGLLQVLQCTQQYMQKNCYQAIKCDANIYIRILRLLYKKTIPDFSRVAVVSLPISSKEAEQTSDDEISEPEQEQSDDEQSDDEQSDQQEEKEEKYSVSSGSEAEDIEDNKEDFYSSNSRSRPKSVTQLEKSTSIDSPVKKSKYKQKFVEVEQILSKFWKERCIVLPFWHSFKKLSECIWRNNYYYHAILVPLMDYLNPGQPVPLNMNLTQISTLFTRVRLSYPRWKHKLDQMIEQLETSNQSKSPSSLKPIYLNHLYNIKDLVTFFISFTHDFRLAVLSNMWEDILPFMVESIAIFSMLDCSYYVRAVVTSICHIDYLIRSQHPVYKLLRACPLAFDEERCEGSLASLTRYVIIVVYSKYLTFSS